MIYENKITKKTLLSTLFIPYTIFYITSITQASYEKAAGKAITGLDYHKTQEIINLCQKNQQLDEIHRFIIKNGLLSELAKVPDNTSQQENAKQTIQVLLDSRISINSSYGMIETPLNNALIHKNYLMVDFLWNKDASPDACNDNGILPIFYAIAQDQEELINKFSSKKNGNFDTSIIPEKAPPLVLAASYGSSKAVTFFLEKKLDLDTTNTAGNSALMAACLTRKMDPHIRQTIVQELIDALADPYIINNQGESALTISTKNTEITTSEIIKLLTSHMATWKKKMSELENSNRTSDSLFINPLAKYHLPHLNGIAKALKECSGKDFNTRLDWYTYESLKKLETQNQFSLEQRHTLSKLVTSRKLCLENLAKILILIHTKSIELPSYNPPYAHSTTSSGIVFAQNLHSLLPAVWTQINTFEEYQKSSVLKNVYQMVMEKNYDKLQKNIEENRVKSSPQKMTSVLCIPAKVNDKLRKMSLTNYLT